MNCAGAIDDLGIVVVHPIGICVWVAVIRVPHAVPFYVVLSLS